MATTPQLEFERDIVDLEAQIQRLVDTAERKGLDVSAEVQVLRRKLVRLREETYDNLTPIEEVQVARHPRRPYSLDYIDRIAEDWIELHGDRSFRDDGAIVGGWARFAGRSVMIIGQQKGRDMKENLRRNFGMPHPEGYRKALRLMRLAEKFGRPVVTLIDTLGAFPGLGSEERGIRGSDRPQPPGNGATPCPDHLRGDWRGHVGWSVGDRGDRQDPHARTLDLQRDLPRGMRGDLVAVCGTP